jgi:hypothetical protein
MFEKIKSRGQAATGAINLLVFAVMGIIAILIYGQFDTTATTSLGATTTAANMARANFSANTYAGYQTLSVGPTVLAAVVVLGIVGLLLHVGRK